MAHSGLHYFARVFVSEKEEIFTMSDTLEKFEFGHHRPMIFKELLPFEALSDSKATNHLKIFPSTTSKSN